MFAWGMEMHLQQVIAHGAHCYAAARLKVGLNGMAIVYDIQRRRIVIEADRCPIRLKAIGDIDGRLHLAGAAQLIIWRETTPFLGSGFARIFPMCRGARRSVGIGRERRGSCHQSGAKSKIYGFHDLYPFG